jgi:two-component system chemotaxis sensor kinase CheA
MTETQGMDAFELEIKNDFINEAMMNLEETEGSFMELESASDQKPLLDKIFRLAHNLKGGSRAVGFGDVAEFTHELENLVLKIQKNEVSLSSEVVTTLLKSNDRLIEMLSELKANIDAKFDNTEYISDIKRWINGEVPAQVASPAPTAEAIPEVVSTSAVSSEANNVIIDLEQSPPKVPDANAFFAEEVQPVAPVVAAQPVAPSPQASSKKPAEKNEKEDEIIRVSLSRIDMLNDYVGELIVLQSVIQQQAHGNKAKLAAAIQQMTKLSKDIQSLSMGLRMLPAKPLVQKLQRVVRDTANALKKEVNLEVVGEGMDIDKSVLDRLVDPLIHILRNAVDHGLETPENRIAAGKNAAGTVVLSFSNQGNHLVVEVSDNGKGIDVEVLRKKATEKGLIKEGQSMTEKQLIHLIFHPGFSTKAVTSEISGRGVGMDVVKTNVENIGGQVEVTTQIGKGSVFRLQIPLSLAVIEGLVVTSKVNRYVIPLNQVQETINLKTQKLHADKLGIGTCFELRGSVVPLFNIEDVLSSKKTEISSESTCLIINVADRPIGLLVTDIIRSQQIVIKPIGNGVYAQKGWIGSCVLGDGLPTLIVSPVDILNGKVVQQVAEVNRERAV